MKNKLIILLGILGLCTINSFGQTNCSKKDLIGQWRQVKSITGIHTNADSLKNLIAGSGKTIGTLNLQSDGTYTYTFLDSTPKRRKSYSFDTATCEIILAKRANKIERSNLEIVYLDNQFLFFKENNNPKGYVTHLLTKM